MVRAGLRKILEASGISVIAEAYRGEEVVDLARRLKPDLVVTEVDLVGKSGIEATRDILSHKAGIKVLVLSAHAGARHRAEAIGAGAVGYLSKECSSEALVAAIAKAREVGRETASDDADGCDRGKRKIPGLTAREVQILRLLAEGKTTGEIASTSRISAKTVIAHRANIMKKLSITEIATLTKYAIREGFIPLMWSATVSLYDALSVSTPNPFT